MILIEEAVCALLAADDNARDGEHANGFSGGVLQTLGALQCLQWIDLRYRFAHLLNYGGYVSL
jgi:hypothetical protein